MKWIAAVLFLLSLAAMASAGLLYGDLLALRERVQPETWLAYMEADGPPQAAYIGFAVLTALSLAAVAGIVYLFSAVSDAILRERRDR